MKTAVCISGLLRALPDFDKNVLSKLDAEIPGEYDLFLHTWDHENNIHLKDLDQNLFKKIKVEPYTEFLTFLYSSKIENLYCRGKKLKDQNSQSTQPLRAFAQFWSTHQSIDLIDNIDNYDIVLKARTDVNLLPNSLICLGHNKIYPKELFTGLYKDPSLAPKEYDWLSIPFFGSHKGTYLCLDWVWEMSTGLAEIFQSLTTEQVVHEALAIHNDNYVAANLQLDGPAIWLELFNWMDAYVFHSPLKAGLLKIDPDTKIKEHIPGFGEIF